MFDEELTAVLDRTRGQRWPSARHNHAFVVSRRRADSNDFGPAIERAERIFGNSAGFFRYSRSFDLIFLRRNATMSVPAVVLSLLRDFVATLIEQHPSKTVSPRKSNRQAGATERKSHLGRYVVTAAAPRFSSGSVSKGSGSISAALGATFNDHKFFPKGSLLPLELMLRVETRLDQGHQVDRRSISHSATLIHSQDPAFPSCWFSGAIDLGDECTDPAFWMLQKISKSEWQLSLRRASELLVTYSSTDRVASFTFEMTNSSRGIALTWPKSITISDGVE